MRFSLTKIFFILINFAFFPCSGSEREDNVQVFNKFWYEAKSKIYPKERENNFFTKFKYKELLQAVTETSSRKELSDILNSFLSTLNVSHTNFYTTNDLEFYFFRSLFSTKDINLPKISHIGVQYKKIGDEYYVREVLEGYPASLNGIRRGDILHAVNNEKFDPLLLFNLKNGEKIKLETIRNSKKMNLSIEVVNESPHVSLLRAMQNSVRIINSDGKKIGYLHLWSGTNSEILEKFKNIVKNQLLGMDGIILDLRGGFGGAWYDYLDPFFNNRNDFFQFTVIDRDGNRNLSQPGTKSIDWNFKGKMVVIINEGVRSGKESLAYQFKKSKRASLVGEKTLGAFTAGMAIFNESSLDYFLYLATAEFLLDGEKIEGVGITPNIHVPYPLTKSLAKDPQFEEALDQMKRLL